MNSPDNTRLDPFERAEIIRSLPGLSETELPFHGHHRIKEHLMRETAGNGHVASARSRRPRTLVLVLGAATCAVAVAVAVAFGVDGSEKRPTVARTEPAAVQLLDRVALAAQAAPAPTVRDGQFLYTKTRGHSTSLSETKNGGMEAARTDESAEHWVSVDGAVGTLTRNARGTTTDPVRGKDKASINGPTYRFLETLPTDPDRLLEVIYADTRLNHGADSESTTGPDQEAFVAIGDLLRTVEAPPAVSAALYRAAARIPGVVLVPEATDAAGRTGVAVARVHNGERTEWIFDKEGLRLLGERTVLLKDSAWGKAGTPVTSVAIVDRGVTDVAGRAPGH
ncbi:MULTISPECIES: CU044_5270 family protein [unclassified Streptomyces]|uniref:CU044_5270 family protein n=1 Tax=unclassified Streptomyces TaxID=2593676 RepID=UPI002E2C7CDA|nr:CU044_5270 family protein [Streptomyces sp. NBC_01439]